MLGKGVISHVVSLHGSNLDGEFHKSQGKVVSVAKFKSTDCLQYRTFTKQCSAALSESSA